MKKIFSLVLLMAMYGLSFGQSQSKETTSASFQGGSAALISYIAENTQYPQVALENEYTGQVNVIFTVTKKGEIKDIYTEKSEAHESLRQEAIRVVKSTAGKWVPATRGNTKLDMIFSVPVNFEIEEEVEEQTEEDDVKEEVQKKKWWKFRK